MRMVKLFMKILLITVLIATSACVTTLPKPKPKWMNFPAESAHSIEGMWINEGGYSRYRIDVTEDQFELIEQKSSNGKQLYGTIKDGKISAFYIHPGKKYKQLWPKMIKCRTRTGHYPISEATLSPDGNQLFFRIFIPDINPGCQATKIVFYLVRE